MSEHPRLFPLRGDEGYFHTGTTPDGRQVVAGLLCPFVAAYFFRPDGSFESVEKRPVAFFADKDPPYRIFAPEVEAEEAQWLADFRLKPGPIGLQAFFDSKEWIGIELLPEHLKDPDDGEEPYEEGWLEDCRAWDESGRFVFWWGNDYFIGPDGEVESS
jgi:hypothetical protein